MDFKGQRAYSSVLYVWPLFKMWRLHNVKHWVVKKRKCILCLCLPIVKEAQIHSSSVKKVIDSSISFELLNSNFNAV